MRMIGYWGDNGRKFNAGMFGSGLRTVSSDDKLTVYEDKAASGKDLFIQKRNNISVILDGYISNWPVCSDNTRDILNLIIDNYLLKGIESLSGLDGSYTVILWDISKGALYLRRDTYGTKLLYYYLSPDNDLFFSNNLDLLVKTTGQKNISRKALHEYLRFLDISPPYTIYEGVYFLEPEKILVLREGAITLKNVEARTVAAGQRNPIMRDVMQDFRETLGSSIEKRISGARHVGIFLSSGIDSALVCALATEFRRDIKSYTVGFNDAQYDESGVVKSITDHLGISHQVFKFTLDEDRSAFNDFVSSIASPFADPAVIPTFQCLRHISNGVDVVLDGTGADSLIGIMPARHIRFILKYLRHIPFKTRLMFSDQLRRLKVVSSYSDLFNFVNAVELLIRWHGWTEEEISSLCGERCDLSHTRFYRMYEENLHKDPFDLYSLLIGALPDDRIHQTASIFGVKVAFPYFDRNVQEFVRSLPLKYKYNDNTSKILFRKLLKEIIPLTIWDKPKHAFDYPFEQLLKHEDYKLPKTFLTREVLSEHGYFDSAIAEKYLKAFLSGDNSVKFKIWALVVFQAWYVSYYKN